jgi:hypothetical protein
MKVKPAVDLARAQNIEGLGMLWDDSNSKQETWKKTGGPAPQHLMACDPTGMRVLMSVFSFIARLFNPRAARRYGFHTEHDQRLKDLVSAVDWLDAVRGRYLQVREGVVGVPPLPRTT